MSQGKKSVGVILVCLLAMGLGAVGRLQGQGDLPPEVIAYADMVLYNGKVLTADKSFTVAEAVAIRDGRFLAVGPTDRILRMAGPNTTRIDLQGNTLTPGFIDAHGEGAGGSHGPSGPSYLPNYSRVRFTDLNDGLRQIKAAIDKAPRGEWVFVKAFRTAAAYQVTRQMLDPISPHNPLLMTQDNTSGVVNSLGLAQVPEDVKAGIHRDKSGEPTGQLTGWAYGVLTYEILPWPEGKAYEAMLEQGKETLKAINALGVTTLGGRRSGLSVQILRDLQRRGEAPMRIRAASEIARLNPHTERYLKRVGNLMDVGDEWFKIAGMTVSSIDATVSEGGFLTRKPKRQMSSWDAFGSFGLNKWEDMVEEGKDWRKYSDYENALLAAKYGWNATDMHIQGDAGVELVLEVFDKINKETPIKGKRFGMVHGTFRPPDLLARMAPYDIQLSMNAGYLFDGAETSTQLEILYGRDEVAGMSPVRSIIDAGLTPMIELTNSLATGGTPVPRSQYYEKNFYLAAMQAFITRKNPDTGIIWGPHQRITREEALKMATAWASRFYGDEDIMGTIEPGKLADLVVLGGDFMTVPEEKLSQLPILKVIVGGKITYERQ